MYEKCWIKYLCIKTLFVSLLYWELIIFFAICCCLTFSITSLHCEKHLQTPIKSQFKIITHKKLTNLNCCPSHHADKHRNQSVGWWWQLCKHRVPHRHYDNCEMSANTMFDSCVNFLCWRGKKTKRKKSSSVGSKRKTNKDIVCIKS